MEYVASALLAHQENILKLNALDIQTVYASLAKHVQQINLALREAVLVVRLRLQAIVSHVLSMHCRLQIRSMFSVATALLEHMEATAPIVYYVSLESMAPFP